MNDFGKLRWQFSPCHSAVEFLDLTISLDDHNRIRTVLYEKPLNLYLYLPPYTCHPSGVFKGFLRGLLYRILRLTTHIEDQTAAIQRLYMRLCYRGYNPDWLKTFFRAQLPSVERRLSTPAPFSNYLTIALDLMDTPV